jgi:hypothetical protein
VTKVHKNKAEPEPCPVIIGGSYGVAIVTLNVDVCFASTTPVLLVTVIVTP